MATVNVTKYNPMEMLNKAFNFADWQTESVVMLTASSNVGVFVEVDTTGAREIHIIQTAGNDDITIKFKNEAGIYPNNGTPGSGDYDFTLEGGNLPFVADKMQMDAVSIKGSDSNTFLILWYK